MDIVLGHHKFGLYLGVISMHFRFFLRSMYRMWDNFGFQIFFGVLQIMGVNGSCWAQAYV